MLLLTKDTSKYGPCFHKTKIEDYDLKGLVKSVIEKSFAVSPGKFGTIEKKYCSNHLEVSINKRSHLVEQNWFKSEGRDILRKDIFEYDHEINRITIFSYGSQGAAKEKRIFQFDEKGEKLIRSSRITDGILDMTVICRYDKKDKLIEQELLYNSKEHNRKQFFAYNDVGHLIEESCLNNKTHYITDNNGKKIECRQLRDGIQINWTVLYRYNSQGNVVNTISLNPDGSYLSQRIYKYEYDDHDNWIRKVEFSLENQTDFPKPEYVVERQLFYFND